MTFQIQSAEGRIFFVNTTNGYLWEVGPDQSMTPVVDNSVQGIPRTDHFGDVTKMVADVPHVPVHDDAADRAAVVGTATRFIDGRFYVGQFQPDDDRQAVGGFEDGEIKQGDIDGPGTLTIREIMDIGKYELRFEGAVVSRASAWRMFDEWVPGPNPHLVETDCS